MTGRVTRSGSAALPIHSSGSGGTGSLAKDPDGEDHNRAQPVQETIMGGTKVKVTTSSNVSPPLHKTKKSGKNTSTNRHAQKCAKKTSRKTGKNDTESQPQPQSEPTEEKEEEEQKQVTSIQRNRKSLSTPIQVSDGGKNPITTITPNAILLSASSHSSSSPLPLIMTGDKRRGMYECDYCKGDISQVPRIKCAICMDFDLCLECFWNTHGCASSASSSSWTSTTTPCLRMEESSPLTTTTTHVRTSKHDPKTHGYRVADSTRFPLFPSLRSVVTVLPITTGTNQTTNYNNANTNNKKVSSKQDSLVESSFPEKKEKNEIVEETLDWKAKTMEEEEKQEEYEDERKQVEAKLQVDKVGEEENKNKSKHEQGIVEGEKEKQKEREELQKDENEIEKETEDKVQSLPLNAIENLTRFQNEDNPIMESRDKEDQKMDIVGATHESDAKNYEDTERNDTADHLTMIAKSNDVLITETVQESKITKDGNSKPNLSHPDKQELSSTDAVPNDDTMGPNTTQDHTNATWAKIDHEKTKKHKKKQKKDTSANQARKSIVSSSSSVLVSESTKQVETNYDNEVGIDDPSNTHHNNKVFPPTSTESFSDLSTKTLAIGEDPKVMWTVEEDLRLLDAIQTVGVGNWDEISEAVSFGLPPTLTASLNAAQSLSGGASLSVLATNNNSRTGKSAKRCMERYLDDFMGRYGHILPLYTLLEGNDDKEASNNKGVDVCADETFQTFETDMLSQTNAGIESTDALNPGTGYDEMNVVSLPGTTEVLPSKTTSTASASGRKRKKSDRSTTPVPQLSSTRSSYNSSALLSGNTSLSKGGTQIKGAKRYQVVLTSSLPGYEYLWPVPYLPPIPGIQVGDEVGRESAVRAEQQFVKITSACSTKEENDAIRADWMENKLNKSDGPRTLPPRLEDIRTLPGSDLIGFMPRRVDMDIEWDNDAELLLADMEFSSTDSAQDRALKIQVIEIYNSRLDERERRKNFMVERKLFDYKKNQAAEQSLPSDERDLVNRMRLFARFHSADEHDKFIQDLLKAKRLRKEIAKLQMYRRMGMTSLAEIEKFELDSIRREALELSKSLEVSDPLVSCVENAVYSAVCGRKTIGFNSSNASKTLPSKSSTDATDGCLWKKYRTSERTNRVARKYSNNGRTIFSKDDPTPCLKNVEMEDRAGMTMVSEIDAQSSTSDAPFTNAFSATEVDKASRMTNTTAVFEIQKLPGYELLSSKEVGLCQRIEMKPMDYLGVKNMIIQHTIAQDLRGVNDLSSIDSKRPIVKIDVWKKESAIDFVLQSGWIPAKLK